MWSPYTIVNKIHWNDHFLFSKEHTDDCMTLASPPQTHSAERMAKGVRGPATG